MLCPFCDKKARVRHTSWLDRPGVRGVYRRHTCPSGHWFGSLETPFELKGLDRAPGSRAADTSSGDSAGSPEVVGSLHEPSASEQYPQK